jgi:hypothetical protein
LKPFSSTFCKSSAPWVPGASTMPCSLWQVSVSWLFVSCQWIQQWFLSTFKSVTESSRHRIDGNICDISRITFETWEIGVASCLNRKEPDHPATLGEFDVFFCTAEIGHLKRFGLKENVFRSISPFPTTQNCNWINFPWKEQMLNYEVN